MYLAVDYARMLRARVERRQARRGITMLLKPFS